MLVRRRRTPCVRTFGTAARPFPSPRPALHATVAAEEIDGSELERRRTAARTQARAPNAVGEAAVDAALAELERAREARVAADAAAAAAADAADAAADAEGEAKAKVYAAVGM